MAVRPEETIVTRQGLSVLMDPAEVSEYLRVPTGTLANWRYQGRGPAFRALAGTFGTGPTTSGSGSPRDPVAPSRETTAYRLSLRPEVI